MSSTWKQVLFVFLICCFAFEVRCQENHSIKVHFLYGSKPARKFKNIEHKWFGGILGGHIGIEYQPNRVFNFLPATDLHIFAHRKQLKGKFVYHSEAGFWRIFGTGEDKVKKLSITVPISTQQKNQLDSITSSYVQNTPYDYAFFGMRCGASTYEIMAQLGILKKWKYRKTYLKIFYPRRLRTRVVRLAMQNNWVIEYQKGTTRRKWEKDRPKIRKWIEKRIL